MLSASYRNQGSNKTECAWETIHPAVKLPLLHATKLCAKQHALDLHQLQAPIDCQQCTACAQESHTSKQPRLGSPRTGRET